MFPCGNDHLNTWKHGITVFLILFAAFVLSIFVIRRMLLKLNLTWAAFGGMLPTLGLLVILCILSSPLAYWKYYPRFEPQEWKHPENRSVDVLRTIISDELLIGKTKDEVIQILGASERTEGRGTNEFYYGNGISATPLVVVFENGMVKEAYIMCVEW